MSAITIKKNILFYALWYSVLCSAQISAHSQENCGLLTSRLNPDTYVFAVDLHGVVFKANYLQMMFTFLRTIGIVRPLIALYNPWFLYDLFNLRKCGVVEEALTKITQLNPYICDFYNAMIDVVNEQSPNVALINSLKKLKRCGYKLYIFSNIGENTFKKLEQLFPDVIEIFDGVLVSQARDEWLQKPQKAYYEKLFTFVGKNPEHIILIDDDHSNILMAQKLGMKTIEYPSKTNSLHELLFAS